MLINDFRNAPCGIGDLVSKAHIIRVPFRLSERTPEEQAAFLAKAPFRNGQWDASFAAPPYSFTIIASTESEPLFVLVAAARRDGAAALLDEVAPAVKALHSVTGKDMDEWIEKVPSVPDGSWLVVPILCYAAADQHRHAVALPAISITPEKNHVSCMGNWTEEERMLMDGIIPSILTTFSLLNCSNVYEERVEPVQSRASRRRGELPPLAYHTLKVRPVRRSSGGSTGTGQPLAEHWVRGHFADYSQGPGLFGNPALKKRFWISPHLAGKAERTVTKDYELSSEPRAGY